MGRDSVAAKARRQAAAAAAAGQGAVAEPAVAAAQPVAFPNPFLEGTFQDNATATSFYIRSNRGAKEDEKSFYRLVDTIRGAYPQGNLAQESRNVLTATSQLRNAADKIFKKLRQDEKSAKTPFRAQEARDAIRQVAISMYGIRAAQYRIKRIAEGVGSRDPGRATVEAGRDLLQARGYARETLRMLQAVNATANLDIRGLRAAESILGFN